MSPTFGTDHHDSDPIAYLDPVRHELHQLRAKVAEHETDTAYMREGYEHDQREIARLAAALEQAEARVEALTQQLAAVYAATVEVERMAYDGQSAVRMIRAALADKEPTP